MATPIILLPGDAIAPSLLPAPSKTGSLTLGPNLRHIPPSTILATTSGTLQTSAKKSALWLDHASGRYLPSPGDLVLAQIHHSSAETFHCSLTPHAPFALLPQLSFEGASRKTRPLLQPGDVVYARVGRAAMGGDVELECVSGATGKGEGLGPLRGGMVFDVSAEFARRVMMGAGAEMGGVVVLEVLGEKVRFEVAVGRNGRVWVDSGSVRETVMIGRLLGRCDGEAWGVERQKKEVKRAVKEG